MHLHTHIHACICIYIHIHTCICIYIHIHICMGVDIHICIHAYAGERLLESARLLGGEAVAAEAIHHQ